MQIVIKIPFRKTVIIFIFIAMLIAVGYNAMMMMTGDPKATLNSYIPIIDTVLWAVLALWFFVLLLYESEIIGHKLLNISTSLGILAVMAKALLSIYLIPECVESNAVIMTFSVIELLICLGLAVSVVRVWFQSE